MLTNDLYIAQLEKMAADEDNAQIADKEFRSNRNDSRRYLGDLFNRADEVEKQMSSAADKVVSGKKESGSPFIKEAARELFTEIISGGAWSKTASPHYREVAFRSFLSELEKLAATNGQTLVQFMPVREKLASQPGLLSRAASALEFRK